MPPKDPRDQHPGFTPTDPPPARRGPLGVPLPPRPTPVIVEPGDSGTPSTGWQRVAGEASRSKVNISLLLLGSIAVGAYQLGAKNSADSNKVAADVESLRGDMRELVKSSDALKTECSNALRSITVIEGRIQVIQSEQVQINSKIR